MTEDSQKLLDLEVSVLDAAHAMSMSNDTEMAMMGRYLKKIAPVWIELQKDERDRGHDGPDIVISSLASHALILAGSIGGITDKQLDMLLEFFATRVKRLHEQLPHDGA